jgi:hypothetical protein
LPGEIHDIDKFIRLSEVAAECRVKRLKDVVKLKLRTSRRLYTMKLDPSRAEEVLKRIKCEVVEV